MPFAPSHFPFIPFPHAPYPSPNPFPPFNTIPTQHVIPFDRAPIIYRPEEKTKEIFAKLSFYNNEVVLMF